MPKSPPRFDFAGQLLGGVILVMLTLGALALILFLLPARHVEAPQGRAAAVAVSAEADFPVGASRVTNWGERIILVVRRGDRDYYALQGTAPTDGCILDWDPESAKVISPCSHLAFDVYGNAVAGLSTEPLRRYAVFLRNGIVYVTDI